MLCEVFLYRAPLCSELARAEVAAAERAVVYIVENANGTFSLWRPFRVDIFIARPGCALK